MTPSRVAHLFYNDAHPAIFSAEVGNTMDQRGRVCVFPRKGGGFLWIVWRGDRSAAEHLVAECVADGGISRARSASAAAAEGVRRLLKIYPPLVTP